ncbi:MAG: cytochrome c peroxidase [Sulfurimonas sp.]|jgi:cytochrome c peroxidase
MQNKFKITLSLLLLHMPLLSADIAKQERILGEKLFSDPILSKNQTQSCSTCHNPEHAFIDNRDNGVAGAGSLGDDQKSIGDRNTPTISYALYSPKFHYDAKKKEYIGGLFYDGRAHTLEEQAEGPPLNPVEMALPSKEFLVEHLKNDTAYNREFTKLYGKDIFNDANKTYASVAKAIASFERTEQFAPFDSKYDRYLRGEYDLTPLEDLGRTLFFSNNNTNCVSCHMLKTEDAPKETFTNYQYHNIGVPQNHTLMSKNVVDAKTFRDHGLAKNSSVNNPLHDGKIKVPSLRNIAVTAPYMHNGVFQKLSTVVEFYDKYANEQRTINPESSKKWEDAEIAVGAKDRELLKKAKPLNERKIKALVAFMNTLTDKRYEHLIKEEN